MEFIRATVREGQCRIGKIRNRRASGVGKSAPACDNGAPKSSQDAE